MYKLFKGYVLFSCIDALYDMGVYTYFFIHGPSHMKKLLDLPPTENFGSIQSRLFMRYCATQEIRKATGEKPKKNFFELVFIRSIKNQLRDQGVRVKNYAVVSGIYKPRSGPRD